MAIVVLVLWMFTAGAGVYVLVTSNLGRARPAVNPDHDGLAPQMASAVAPSASTAATESAASAASSSAATESAAAAGPSTSGPSTSGPSAAAPAKSARAARREERRAARDRWDPPSLAQSKSEPWVPQFRSLVEFAHPALGITGLAFWLGFTLVHSRPLGWIAFGLVAVTACVGLAWFTANVRANRKTRRRDPAEPAPSFNGRVIALHGTAAAVTLTLAALTVLIARG
jgi:hypothetical protein